MKKILVLALALLLIVNVSFVAPLPKVTAQTEVLSGTDIIEYTSKENSSVTDTNNSDNSTLTITANDTIGEPVPVSETDSTSNKHLQSQISHSDAPTLLLSPSNSWDGKTSEPFSGGTGTADDPYLIANGAQLYYLSLMISSDSSSDYVAKCYKLTDDIDLNDKRFTPLKTFKGTLDGDGHTIKGINIVSTGSDYSGLIRTGDSCTIKSLTLDGSVSGESYTGGFLGYASSRPSVFTDCTNKCAVTGTGSATGGFVGRGYIYCSFTNCINTGKITGKKDVGGIVGYHAYASITLCYNTGDVSGETNVGGIVGHDYREPTYSKCANAGTISAEQYYCGGIIGYSESSNGSSYPYKPTLNDVYNCGNISAKRHAGGLAGFLYGAKSLRGYSVGQIIADTYYGDIFTSSISGSYSYAYYLSGNNPDATDTYGTANSAEDMVIPAGYAGFNFTDVWDWDESGDYPYPILKGMGVISNDYKTYTVTFADWDGTVLDTQNVQNGKAATAPTEIPERKNYTFTGWDKDFSNITSDLTVTAQYEQAAFDVTVAPSENGDVEIADDNVDIGDDIIIYITPDEGYRIDEITVNGESVDFSQLTYENGKFVLTVSGKNQDTEIDVSFEKLPDSSGCAVDMNNSFKAKENISFKAEGVWGDYDVLLENDIRYIPSRWHHAEPSGDWNGEISEDFTYADSFTQATPGKYTLHVEFTKYILTNGIWIASNDTITISNDYTVISSTSSGSNNVKTGYYSTFEQITIINIMLLCVLTMIYCLKKSTIANANK